MNVVTIPARPEPELHLWTLPPPCNDCTSCHARRQAEFAVTYMDAHFARTIERLDAKLPNYLHLVDRLMAERDREASRLRDNIPYCDVVATVVLEAP